MSQFLSQLRRDRLVWPGLWYLIVGGLGQFLLFHDVYQSGFQLLVGEYGDGRLCNLFLEHSWQWLVNREYRGELFSPIFFAPQPNVLAMSENLFGTAPLYWLVRLMWDADRAFTAWAIGLSWLNYGAMVWVLRRWQVHPGLASLGGFLYGFSLLRAVRLAHAQWLPSCFIPIALYVLWQFLQRPTRRGFLLLLGLSYWQLLASVYLGWFLILGLVVMVMVACCLQPSSWAKLYRFMQTSWPWVIGGFAVWLGAIGGLFAPYLQMRALVGARSYAEVQSMLPRWHSWLAVPPVGNLWSGVLAPFSRDLPILHEHFIFLGMFIYGLMIVTGCSLGRRSTWLAPQRSLVQVCFVSGLILVWGALLGPGNFSLWWLVYHGVPGATAIRAVTRIAGLIWVFWLVAGLVVLDRYLARCKLRRRAWAVVLSGLLVGNMAEQSYRPLGIPVVRQLHDRQEMQMTQREMRQILSQHCDWGYYAVPPIWPPTVPQPKIQTAIFPHTYEKTLPPMLVWIYAQTLAMWAGLEANVPMVNGYSGATLPGFPAFGETWPLPMMLSWVSTKQQPGRFCYITDRYRPVPIAPTAPQLAGFQQSITSAHYQTLVFVPKQDSGI